MSRVKNNQTHEWEHVCVPTRAGGVGFVLIVATVVVSIAQPAERDAAVVFALKSVGGASVLICGKDGVQLEASGRKHGKGVRCEPGKERDVLD